MLAVLGNVKVVGVLALAGVLGYGYVKISMLESEVEKKSLEVKVLHNTVNEQRKYFESKIKADLATLENKLEKEKLVEGLDVQDVDSVDIDSYDIWF
jgi:hypothetical protein